MKLVIGLIIGVLATLLIIALGVYITVSSGLIPAGMDSPQMPLEKWCAHHDLNAFLQREAKDTSPLKADEATLAAGEKVYASNCSGCHGTPLTPAPSFGAGFYPEPTPFAKHTVCDDPESETYWKIKHGIRWTGMPMFKNMLSDTEIWQVTQFLKNMDKLPPKVNAAWNAAK
jgi:mono/diheme cytochrome c family protein